MYHLFVCLFVGFFGLFVGIVVSWNSCLFENIYVNMFFCLCICECVYLFV